MAAAGWTPAMLDRLRRLDGAPASGGGGVTAGLRQLDWVIAGGESGTRARPVDLSWIRGVVGECREAGIPVFVKQLGSHPEIRPRCGGEPVLLELQHAKGGDIDEWPADLQIREFPTTKQQEAA